MKTDETVQPPAKGEMSEAQIKLVEARAAVARLEQEIGIPEQASTESAKPQTIRTEIVVAIKPSQREPDFGGGDSSVSGVPTHYYLSYVTGTGQQETVQCTRDIWLWLQQMTPWFDVHAEWILDKDSSKKIVAVLRKPHLRQGPLANRFDASPDDLVLQKTGNVYEPVSLPLRFTSGVLQEALTAMNEAGNVKPGNVVGRFVIKKMQSDEQSTVVALDIKN
jgi:hypothetical protein